jgi:nucleoside-diphosphate-sugar epimerase
MPTAFVTGGSGFVGGRLVARLVGDGWTVRALARSPAAASAVGALGAEPVRGDVNDEQALAAGTAGAEVAFHAAAKVDDWGPWAAFRRVNVDGTRAVVEACRRAGVRRFVHVGTEAAILRGQALRNADETVPLAFDSPAPYSSTKALAERVALAGARAGFDTMVVRPRFVWGRGDTTLLPRMVELARQRRLRWVGGGRHHTSTTHVDNTVHGLLLAADRGRSGGVWFVTDGSPVVFREFVSELLRTQGVEPPEGELPAWVAHAVMAAGEAAWRRLPLPGAPPLTRFAYWTVTRDCTLSDRRAREDLGYAPVVSRARGLAAMREDSAGRAPTSSARG